MLSLVCPVLIEATVVRTFLHFEWGLKVKLKLLVKLRGRMMHCVCEGPLKDGKTKMCACVMEADWRNSLPNVPCSDWRAARCVEIQDYWRAQIGKTYICVCVCVCL